MSYPPPQDPQQHRQQSAGEPQTYQPYQAHRVPDQAQAQQQYQPQQPYQVPQQHQAQLPYETQQPYQVPVPPYMVGPHSTPYGQTILAAPKKRKKLPFILGGIGAVLLLCIGGSVISAFADSSAQKSFADGYNGQTQSDATPPTGQATTKSVTTPATAKPTVAAPVATAVPGIAYKTLTDREWKLMVKNPDGHAGEKITIYGVVTQFDGATGTELFQANAGPTKNEDPSDASTDFTGDAGTLASLVEGDEFRAQAVVIGAESYDTQDGGNTTVPELQVISIKTL